MRKMSVEEIVTSETFHSKGETQQILSPSREGDVHPLFQGSPLPLQEFLRVVIEGTGIGYKRKTYLKRVKDHLRCEVVVTKGKKLIQYVEVGRAMPLE